MDTVSLGFEVVVILVLIIANGIFAMTEMAIVSSRKARLEKLADEGDDGARVALSLAEEPTPMLSAIQIGITLIGILTGTFGGASLSKPLAEELRKIAFTAPYADGISLALVVTIITYVSLIIGELVPKRLALNSPEPIATMMARPMAMFSRIAAPVVAFLSFSTNSVVRLLGIKESDEPPVTEDEIRILMEQGTEAGTFERAEQDMVHRVFELGDMRASSLMTPRTQMVWLDLEDSLENNLDIIIESGHTRFPVAKGSLDEFVGIVYSNDILSRNLNRQPIHLEELAHSPVYVPRSMKALKTLEVFKQSGAHEAVVLDEFGGVEGFITLHDILEHIIGEIPLADEEGEPQIIQRDDGSFLVDGLFSVSDFKEFFEVDKLPDEDRDHFQTLGGFVTSYLGHIPAAGEKFDWSGLRIEIIDMDRVRVDKVLITKLVTTDPAIDNMDIP